MAHHNFPNGPIPTAVRFWHVIRIMLRTQLFTRRDASRPPRPYVSSRVSTRSRARVRGRRISVLSPIGNGRAILNYSADASSRHYWTLRVTSAHCNVRKRKTKVSVPDHVIYTDISVSDTDDSFFFYFSSFRRGRSRWRTCPSRSDTFFLAPSRVLGKLGEHRFRAPPD